MTSLKPLTVTDFAAKKIVEFAAADKKDGWGLKVLAKNNDGFEPAYEMDFQKEPDEHDEVLIFGKTKIFLDPESAANLEGSTLDFLETPYGSGFKIENPAFPSMGCSGSCSSCGGCG
jgi:iron-sulfur cluster assembly accessory protein